VVSSYAPQATSGLTLVQVDQPPVPLVAGQPDVLDGSSVPSSLHLRRIAADDWAPAGEQPITGIHWWGSFDGWSAPYLPANLPMAYHIAIWTDEPDPLSGKSDTSSHPGTLVWETYCVNWTWALAGYESLAIGADPATCFQFSCWLSQDQWFWPEPDGTGRGATSTYWLSIAALHDPKGAKVDHEWGFKTRPHTSGEAAVIVEDVTLADDLAIRDPLAAQWPPTLGARWAQGRSMQASEAERLDLAFQLTTFATPYPVSEPPAEGRTPTADNLDDLSELADDWLQSAR
jgi:hypothetical protein